MTKKPALLNEATALLAMLVIAFSLSFFAPYSWFFDQFSHFKIQYVIGGLFIGVWMVVVKKWGRAALSFLICAVCVFQISQAYDFIPHQSEVFGSDTFKIMHYNRRYTINAHLDLVDFIREESPDVAVIQEARVSHLNDLSAINDKYPYRIEEPRQNAFGMIVLSKHPFETKKVTDFDRIVLDNIQIHVLINLPNAQKISLYAIHPPPPMNALLQKQRNTELELTAQDVSTDNTKNIIMLGDWNMTPFSPHFTDLLNKTGLKNQVTESSSILSWPSLFVLPVFQIPIDHILHKGNLSLLSKQRGPAMGSDHYPIIATFSVEQ